MVYERESFPPPKVGRFLALSVKYSFNGYGNPPKLIGFIWKEAYWNGKEFSFWNGSERLSTTENLYFEEWADLPISD